MKKITVFIAFSFASFLSAQTPIFYGMTDLGGTLNNGVIFSFNPVTNIEDTIHCFGRGEDGNSPPNSLVYDTNNGLFYATTPSGGSLGRGAIISFNPVTNVEDTVYSITTSDGLQPNGNVVYCPVNGLFYATVRNSGAFNDGTIISFNPTTNSGSLIHSFRGTPDGAAPYGNLVYDWGTQLLYAMIVDGGRLGFGTIINLNPGTNVVDTIHTFGSGFDGKNPYGELVYCPSNGLYYGMTTGGGLYDYGTIISFNVTTHAETVVWNFGNGTDGTYPRGDLVYDANNGLFYGMTYQGGSFNGGIIFSFNPNTNAKNTVHNFGSGFDGYNPMFGSLVYYPDNGLFYGMTANGGSLDRGTIFNFDPSTNVEDTVHSFGIGDDGKYPSGQLSLYGHTTGITGIKGENVKVNVFPNPGNGHFTIQSSVVSGQSSVEVYNMLGEKVYSAILPQTPKGALSEINLSNQSNGVYLYRVLNEDGSLVGEGKMVIQK